MRMIICLFFFLCVFRVISSSWLVADILAAGVTIATIVLLALISLHKGSSKKSPKIKKEHLPGKARNDIFNEILLCTFARKK